MNKKIALSFLLLALSFIGCGYKPTSTYTTPILGNKIYTEVSINVQNPTDAVFLKDALNEAVVGVFNAKISTNEADADSVIKLTISSSRISAIDYDKNGYPILYRASASLNAYIKDTNGSLNSYSGSGSYDFSIASDSVLSDDIKHNAIKESFLKALQVIELSIAKRGLDDN